MPKARKGQRGRKVLDVAIVGGGVAGTYVAWRLASTESETLCDILRCTSRSPSIELFEATRRIGGRLLTVKIPGTEFQAELGGMRYTSSHILLKHTIRELCEGGSVLTVKSFGFKDRLMYLRGKHVKVGSVSEARCHVCKASLGIPYELDQKEIGSPVLLAKRAIVRALKKIRLDVASAPAGEVNTKHELLMIAATLAGLDDDGLSLNKMTLSCRQWNLLKQYGVIQGRHLYQLGFWNLLQHFLSSEGFLFVRDALGYESVFANWNAAEAIPWFLADFGVDYFTLREGLEAVPLSLATLFEGPHPQLGHREHTLQSVERDPVDKTVFRLTFEQPEQVFARHVILALPKEALRKVDFHGPVIEDAVPTFKKLLEDSVTAHPLFKLFLAYDSAWWRDARALGSDSGRATTDMPIRQVYYYAPQKDDVSDKSARAVVMASYSDEHYVDFWKPLIRTSGPPPFLAPFRREVDQFDDKEEDVLDAFGVAEPMLLKAHRQIALLHPELEASADGIPMPYVGVVKDWSTSPFCGGWHSWNPRVSASEVVSRLVQPFRDEDPDLKLFTCGEAFSLEQGWIEGALKSAELVLHRLGVPAPAISADNYEQVRCAGYEEYIAS